MTDDPAGADLRAALLDAMRVYEDQRANGVYPILGQDNDIRRFADWIADYLATTPPAGADRESAFYQQGWEAGYAFAASEAAAPGAEHPHDGYAYDGCVCVCCVNVRALATPPAGPDLRAALLTAFDPDGSYDGWDVRRRIDLALDPRRCIDPDCGNTTEHSILDHAALASQPAERGNE